MSFQLAALQYSQPALYNTLLEHHTITRTTDAIGTSYDHQILYESSATRHTRRTPPPTATSGCPPP